MGKPFEHLFGVNASDVIIRMDGASDDISLQAPRFVLPLQRVGMVRDNVPVNITHPFDGQGVICLNTRVSLSTGIPGNRRGLHMSRVGDLIAEASSLGYGSLLEYIETIADKIRNSQYGESAHVKVSAPFSFVSPVRGWKKGKDKLSLDTIWLSASVDGTATPNKSVGVAVDNMTACPCVQQTYKHTLEETKGDVREAILTVAPLLTHSQRCKTEVEIVNAIRFPSVREILDVLDGVLVRVQNTLPREHELALVYRAHRDPQFVEDVVRSVMAGIFKLMKSDNQDTTIKVDSVGQESIHGFDIHAATSSTVSELARILSD